MKRFFTSCMFAVLCAPAGLAHADITQKKPAPSIGDIELPTQQEIEDIKASLPDFNAIINDFMTLAQDESFQDSLKGGLDAMKGHLDNDSFKPEDGELPDITGMMGAMLDMIGDEKLIGGLIEQIEPMQDIMKKHVPDAFEDSGAAEQGLDWQ